MTERRIYSEVSIRKIVLLILLVLAIGAFYLLGGDRYLSYQEVRTHSIQIHLFIRTHPWESMILYSTIYILAAVLCLPGTTLFLTMVGGGLFGFWEGTLLAALSSTLGALLSFFTVRYLFRNLAARYLEGKWEGVRSRLKRHGVRYILTLRLTSAFPYFLLNPLLALTSISPWTFLWTTAVGIFPTTLFYSYVGYRMGLMKVERAFKLLPILVMLPIALTVLVSPWLKRRFSSA